MNIDTWVDGYKVRVFPWIDGKRIYANVQYYRPGQSVSQPPVFDKSVFINDNEAGRRMISEYLHTLINYIVHMKIAENTETVITVS